jgi:hypothetical protein
MNIKVESDQATLEEALKILMEHLPPSKVARLLSIWQVGRGDYVEFRQNLFSEETVDSLYEKMRERKSDLAEEIKARTK